MTTLTRINMAQRITAAVALADGYKLWTFESDGTTPKTTWTNIDGSTENENPIILNSLGECDIFIDTNIHTFELLDADDVQVRVWEGICGVQSEQLPYATEDDAGVVVLASNSDIDELTSTVKAVTPDDLDRFLGQQVAAAIDAQITVRLDAYSLEFSTGQVAAFFTTPTGWIYLDGGTIGDGGSGATTRANADTEALFAYYWENTDNTVFTIQTSGGANTTKGASAAVDFAAHRRMPILSTKGRFPRGLDDGIGLDAGRALGSLQAEMIGPHTHPMSGDGYSEGAGAATEEKFVVATNDTYNRVYTNNTDVQNNAGTENRPVNFAVKWYQKL